MSNTVVVYIYTDPAFKGDLTSTIKVLKHRGFRVVKGDNPDELLFLLQVGRPAAVIYTLSNRESKTSASYQMVSRRAFDLLVPIVLVGPDDPRDGVLCVYPEGRKTVEKHLPYHSIVQFISDMDENPPSTMSRPPDAVKKLTVGRGKTLLNWKGGAPSVPPGSVSHEAVTVPPPAPVMPPSDFDETRPVPQEEMATRNAPKVDTSAGGAGGKFRIVAIAMGVVIIVAIGVVVFLTMRPAAPAPEAFPRISGPIVGSPIVEEPLKETTPVKAVTPVTPPPPPTVPPQPAGEYQASKQRPKIRPPIAPAAVAIDPGGRLRFPGHFRDGTATFWFGGYEEEQSFLNIIKARSAAGSINIFGRATIEELTDGKTYLGLSRAWAVEKYLIRMGVDPDTIQTERADPVNARSDVDERGWARNRWVEISFN